MVRLAKETATEEVEEVMETEVDDDLVEYCGQKVKSIDKKRMSKFVKFMKKRKVGEKDIEKFVKQFSEYEEKGILKLNIWMTVKCIMCHARGHIHQVCPKTWDNKGEDTDLCFTCGKPGYPHKECKGKRLCFNCKKTGHERSQCPEEDHEKAEKRKRREAEEEDNEDHEDMSPKKKKKKSTEEDEDKPVKSKKKKSKKSE